MLPQPDAFAPLSDEFHEAFLERAASSEGTESSTVALSAFLTMRLVDQFAPHRVARDPTALQYQIWSTHEFLETIDSPDEEVSQLERIVGAAEQASRTGHHEGITAQLLSYAEWLESELHLPQASDVLATALRLAGPAALQVTIKGLLQRGRVLRHLGDYDASQRSYQRAGELARESGDTHSELLSRIGRGVVLQKTGNLPESERLLRSVLDEAVRTEDREAEARSCHDLAGTLHHMSRGAEGAPLAFRAYQLYERPIQRVRALSDTGQILKELGLHGPAKHAFLAVIDQQPPPEIRLRVVVELVDLSAMTQDRMSFERWKKEVIGAYERMPPDERVDFQLKVGAGLARFGRFAAAEEHLRLAMALAEEHALPEWLFKAEAVLRDVQARTLDEHTTGAMPPIGPAAVRELRATIEELEQFDVC